MSVLVISAGVAVASYGELRMSLVGLASMLISVVAESTRLVMMQYLMVGGRGGRGGGGTLLCLLSWRGGCMPLCPWL